MNNFDYDPDDFDNDEVMALAKTIELDSPSLTMEPLRQQLAVGAVRTFDDLVGLVVHLGYRAGRDGLDVALDFMQTLLAIPDLNDHEIALLADVVDTLGSDNE